MTMTEDDARLLARTIVHEVKKIDLPIENETERRAICLRLAIDTKGIAFSLKNDGTPVESAQQVVDAARLYYDFVTGDGVPEGGADQGRPVRSVLPYDPSTGPCYDPQCGDSTWDHDCPAPPAGYAVRAGINLTGDGASPDSED